MTNPQPDMVELLAACGAPRTAPSVAGAGEREGTNADARVVFAQPWHAEAVATTLHLCRTGLFTWREWVDVFSAEIAVAPQTVPEDANSAYYRQWLAALQTILTKKRVLEMQEIIRTQEDWRRSYLHTRHGDPVVFQRELADPSLNAVMSHDHDHDHDHDHHHHHHDHDHRDDDGADMPVPVAVSPALR